MEIRYVREFVSLAETGSYSETAERLFASTSALSRHIKTLESEMGVPLFNRTTRKVTLNRYGQMFLPYARELLETDDACTRAFSAARQDGQETIRVGSIPMMKAYRITDLLAEYQYGNKAVTVDLVEGDSYVLIPKLRNEEIDVAFLRDRDDTGNEFVKIPFAEDTLGLVVPAAHPLAKQDAVGIEQLRNEPLLLIGKDAFMYELCTELCRQTGFEPKVSLTSYHADNLIDLVSRGAGAALLMKKPAEMFLNDSLRMVDIAPTVTTTIYLAYLPGKKMKPHVRKFIELAKGIEC